MPRSPYRPAADVDQQRWEFIWWGFGKRARRQRGFQANAPVHKSWRLGPCEIRIYLEAPKPRGDFDDARERPIRRIDGPNDMNG